LAPAAGAGGGTAERRLNSELGRPSAETSVTARRYQPLFQYPDIDPVAFALGPVQVRWYGLMYLIGFVLGWLGLRARAKRADSPIEPRHAEDLIFYVAIGVFAGGRIGYMLFYDFASLRENPLSLFMIWRGGMSFHGGLIGVLAAVALFARRIGRPFFAVTDFIAPWVPIGLGLGRIGNFINGELWGKPTEVPWGFVVDGVARHPSQLYEAFLEGLVLFLVLLLYSRKPRPLMAVSGLFLLLYGSFRVGVEFVRLPDAHIGYLAFGWLTEGQVLTAPMIVAGLVLLALAFRRKARDVAVSP
jgi:phosphatidylglycerol---prolipoprotein diacylglyceryl transferase